MYIFSSNICYFKVFSWVVKIFLYGAMKFFWGNSTKKKKEKLKIYPLFYMYMQGTAS